MSKTRKQPKTGYEDLVALAKDTVRQSIEELQRSIATVADDLKGGYDSKKGSHLAYLSGYATQALEAVRKLDAQERKQAAALTTEEFSSLLLAHMEQMPREHREILSKRLAELADDDGLLAH